MPDPQSFVKQLVAERYAGYQHCSISAFLWCANNFLTLMSY